ncbi:MAG: hypothetical protein ACRDLS_10805 [Solirubrobacteraceae bacterium]
MQLLIKPKKACCKSNPRCKRCPVVAKRLVKRGLAERRADGIVVVKAGVTKKQRNAARKR